MAGTGGKKILLVDYEVSKMKATEDFLIQAGFEVVKAFDGLDALEKFAEEQPNLVLLSAMLPKLHGFEVCKAIKQSDLGKKTPVLITTSVYKSYKYKRQAMKDYMADDYILKPFNYEELLIKIREHLGLSESEEDVSQTKPIAKTVTQTPSKPAPAAPKKEEGRSFEKLLDETLETLLRTSEIEEVSDDAKPEKVDRDLDSILEDTLSGLLKVPSKSAPAAPATPKPADIQPSPPIPPPEPKFEEPEPPPDMPTIPEPEPTNEVEEIDRIIDEAIQIIDDAELQTQKAKTAPALSEEKTQELPKSEIESVVSKPVEAAPEISEGVRFGKYILIEKIATGGMAEMWKAKQRGPEGFEKLVALKRILPHLGENEDFITMFIDEGKVAAQLTHPNIAQIYELGEIEGSYYIAMEYIAGKDLRTILRIGRRQNKPLTIDLSVEIAIKLLAGLHYAHRKKGFNNEFLNIVHRDVSPANILASYEGEVKLVDFGIAKAAAKNSVTQTGALKGKILYMSPEQAWGQPVDRRSDIFSVGVLLYEMLTGKRVFLADNEIAILQKVREWDPPPPSSANARISSIIDKITLKAIKKNPQDRYQTAEDMKLELESYLAAQKPSRRALDLGLYMRTIFAEDIEREAPEILESIKDLEPFDFESSAVHTSEERTMPLPVVTAPVVEPVIEAEEKRPAPEIEPQVLPEPESISEQKFEQEPQPLPETVVEDEQPSEPVSQPEIEPAAEPTMPEPEPIPEVVQKFSVEDDMIREDVVVPEISDVPATDLMTEQEISEPEPIDFAQPQTEQEPVVEPKPESAKVTAKTGGKQKHGKQGKQKPSAVKIDKPKPVQEPIVTEQVKSQPPVKAPVVKPIEPKQELPARDISFDEDFLKPPSKPPIYKNPLVLAAGGVVVLILLILIFSSGGEKPAVVPDSTPTAAVTEEPSPTVDLAAMESPTPTGPTATNTPLPTKTPPGAKTPATTATASPSQIPVTVTPEPTKEEVKDTPTSAPATVTPEPTKLPAGTYIEHPETKPEALEQEYPQMPPAARQMGVEGNVILKVLISETGAVLDVAVLKADDQLEKSGCVKAATDAVKSWKFKPATHQGVPVKTHVSLLVPFLKKAPPKSVARPIL